MYRLPRSLYSLFTGALPGHCGGKIFRVARRGGRERRMSKRRGDMEIWGIEGWEGVAWHFHMRRHGSQVSAGCLRRGSCCSLCLVNSNATHTHTRHRAAVGNTVLCCCIINKSSVLDHLSCGLWGVQRDATTPRQAPIKSQHTTWFLCSHSKFKPVDFFFNSKIWSHSQQSGGGAGGKCRWWRRKQEDDH